MTIESEPRDSELLGRFNLECDALNDAMNYALGHVIQNDKDAALNSVTDAKLALDRIEEMLEED